MCFGLRHLVLASTMKTACFKEGLLFQVWFQQGENVEMDPTESQLIHSPMRVRYKCLLLQASRIWNLFVIVSKQ